MDSIDTMLHDYDQWEQEEASFLAANPIASRYAAKLVEIESVVFAALPATQQHADLMTAIKSLIVERDTLRELVNRPCPVCTAIDEVLA